MMDLQTRRSICNVMSSTQKFSNCIQTKSPKFRIKKLCQTNSTCKQASSHALNDKYLETSGMYKRGGRHVIS